ncbi:hypothetical protein BRD02_08770 [Halobacteriales archaeon QS_8_69_73]|nr:MAG: hypothetical protein BRD02_08770 [Halobacteriales archaeon QS_8_69_73]
MVVVTENAELQAVRDDTPLDVVGRIEVSLKLVVGALLSADGASMITVVKRVVTIRPDRVQYGWSCVGGILTRGHGVLPRPPEVRKVRLDLSC